VCGRITELQNPVKDFWTPELQDTLDLKGHYYRKRKKVRGLNYLPKILASSPKKLKQNHVGALSYRVKKYGVISVTKWPKATIVKMSPSSIKSENISNLNLLFRL
jgi:mRNA-degrading endonuclease RelE of RelBE toxin-antitoxin system